MASGDRRTRKREARRDHLLDLAADIVERDGVDGVTMAALADAADYATASLYTYFASRSALLAALQQRALGTLATVARDHLATWDAALLAADPPVDARVAALARLLAFSDRFLAAPDEHPRDFRLQQQLLVDADSEDTSDAASVVPAAMAVLDLPRRLLAAAVDADALEPHRPVADPIGQPLEGALVRTLSWVVAMNGALLVDRLSTGVPITGAGLGAEITESLLRGWGADAEHLAAARDVASSWTP